MESGLFIYLLVALALCCFAQAFSSCGEMGLLFTAAHRLLVVVAALVRSTGSRHTGYTAHGLSCLTACGILPDQGSAPCTDRRIPSHCTTREVPGVVLNEVPAFLLQEESARAGSPSLVWLPPQNPQWPHCPSPGQPSLACPTQELVVPPFHPQVQEERLVLGLLSPFEALAHNGAPSSLLTSGCSHL